MNIVWMDSPWMKALGWTFIHSIWQIAIIGLLMFIALRLIPGKKANLRYGVSTLSLLIIFISALITFIISLPEKTQEVVSTAWILVNDQPETLSNIQLLKNWLEERMPYMLIVWFGGITILLFRLAISMGWVWHVKREKSVATEIEPLLQAFLKRIHFKSNVKVGISNWIPSPVTLGHFKPVILFPIGLINQLTPSEVEAIIAHELAHIARHDYLTNVIQSCMETLFYYHPVTWWISRTVRVERENRADDLAVQWFGDKMEYAKAILAVQEIESRRGPALALGFASKKGQMLTRIHRILNLPYKNQIHMEKSVLFSLGSIICLVFTLTQKPELPSFLAQPDPEPAIELASLITHDTLPSEGMYQIHKKTNDKEIKVEIENGNVLNLEIDGVVIPEEEYEAYQLEIEALLGTTYPGEQSHQFEFFHDMVPPVPNFENFDFKIQPFNAIPGNIQFGNDDVFIVNGDSIRTFSFNFDTMIFDVIRDGDSMPFKIQAFDIAMGEQLKHLEGAQRLAEIRIEKAHKQLEKAQREWEGAARDAERHHDIQIRRWEEGDAKRRFERDVEIMVPGHPAHPGADVFTYIAPTPELTLSQMLVHDELVSPGEEATFVLTPDKLKINGKKMPDALHRKYLRRYNEMQGFNMTGDFRVEFKTKTSQEF